MKKITDERLILRNLHHFKITYIVQTVGILFLLGFDLVTGGIESMRSNPLWLIFILTSVISAYLSIGVSVEQEGGGKNPRKAFMMSLAILLFIVIAVVILTSSAANTGWTEGIGLGSLLLICGFIPIYYVFKLRVKQEKDNDEMG